MKRSTTLISVFVFTIAAILPLPDTVQAATEATVTNLNELKSALNDSQMQTVTIAADANIVVDAAIKPKSEASLVGAPGAGGVPSAILDGEGKRIIDVWGGYSVTSHFGGIHNLFIKNADGTTVNNANGNTSGGAVFVQGDLKTGISNSVFQNNTGGDGSAIYVGGNVEAGISNVEFANNTSANRGALYVNGMVNGDITDSRFLNNTSASSGGGLSVWGGVAGNMRNVVFEGNTGSGNYGGGMSVTQPYTDPNNGTIHGGLYNVTFKNNSMGQTEGTGSYYGGGLGLSGNILGGVHDSLFEGNQQISGLQGNGAGRGGGGGLAVKVLENGINNTTFRNNSATGVGGGLQLMITGLNGYQLTGGINGSEFTGNSAFQGGAIYGATIDGGITGTLFKNNVSTGSYGGAIILMGIDGGINNSQFIGNRAESASAGMGGAIMMIAQPAYNGPGIITGGINNTLFQENYAGVHGGAMYINKDVRGGINDSVFKGNEAGGSGGGIYAAQLSDGITRTEFSSNKAGGHGGAIYSNVVSGPIDWSEFKGNEAGNSGGALFVGGDVALTNTMFTNNKAGSSASSTVPTSGRGGAILHNNTAVSGGDGLNTLTINLTDPNLSVLFSGNTHNPGGTGVVPNSIYFATSALDGETKTTRFVLNTAAGTNMMILDPFASQADGTMANETDVFSPLVVDLEKRGAGALTLRGQHKMDSETHWTVYDGELRLVCWDDITLDPARARQTMGGQIPTVILELGHPDSSFTLKSGARMVASLNLSDQHLIRASHITLESGSSTGVTGELNEPFLARAAVPRSIPVLILDHRETLDHQQAPEQEAGVMRVGLVDQDYRLVWGGEDNATLYIEFVGVNPSTLRSAPMRMGTAAMTAPSVTAINNPSASLLFGRARDIFSSAGGLMPGNNVWATPVYAGVNQSSGAGLTGYRLNRGGIMAGFDHVFERAFAGVALNAGVSRYRSDDADVNARDIEGLVYGGLLLPGELELTGLFGVGRVDNDQTRHVHGFSYQTDYDSSAYRLAVELGRSFPLSARVSLRPFVSYELVSIHTAAHKEAYGPYAIDVDSFRQNVQRIKAGALLGWKGYGAFVNGQVYYLGNIGGRRASTGFTFVQNALERFTAYTDPLDASGIGFSLRGGLDLSPNTTVSAGYTGEKTKETMSHEGTINFRYRF